MWPSVRGRNRRFTQRGRMPALMLRERLRGEGCWAEWSLLCLPKTTDLAALILSIRVYKGLDVGYMLTLMKKKLFFFPRFNSENGIWIECDAHHYQPEERLLVKPDKFPNCERVIVCQYSSCSSFFVWRWAEVSLHRLLPAGVTTWLNDFWLREKLSPESQWKLTSMPVLFFSSVL